MAERQVAPTAGTRAPGRLDAAECAREPIHIPGAIQPAGSLLAVNPLTMVVVQAAVTPGDAPLATDQPVGKKLAEVLPTEVARLCASLQQVSPSGADYLGLACNGDQAHHVIAHRSDEVLVVEFERALVREPGSFDDVYPHVRGLLDRLQSATSVNDVAALAAQEIRAITGLDRVLVYRFDEDWNGAVIGEDRNDKLPSYFDLRFPAADIPEQARELYRLNRLRLIADVDYVPTLVEPALNPESGKPLDLSHAVLRSVSPVHLEYMRNMGTAASMSISLVRDGRLWGLISCHNKEPARVPYHVRTACDFIGQVLSMQIAAIEGSALAERRNELRGVQSRLLAHMARAGHYIEGLKSDPEDLLQLTAADGVAIIAGGDCALLGQTPTESQVRQLVGWLASHERQDLYVTDHLSGDMPGGEALMSSASGVLAVSISQLHDSYVIWFRPELVRTVTWSGDPRKQGSGAERLHPRKSFEAWQEIVRERSLPWGQPEVDAANELRTAIVDIVLRKAEEMAALSERLTTINKELEAFSYSVSHDLRAPFRHIVGYAQLLRKHQADILDERGEHYIGTIIESAISAGELVDDLLSFSQMGRATITPLVVGMDKLVRETKDKLALDDPEKKITWDIAPLPDVYADPGMLRVVVQNLLENAVKFSRERDAPKIKITCDRRPNEYVFCVRDNGTGFDMAYVSKLFGVFQRLHRVEDFEGTGIGLANVKRVIQRHGGRVWAEGELNKGAAFYFALPRREDLRSARPEADPAG